MLITLRSQASPCFFPCIARRRAALVGHLELIPINGDYHGLGPVACLVCRRANPSPGLLSLRRRCQLGENARRRHHGVIDGDMGTFVQQPLHQLDHGRVLRVGRVLLKREPENGYRLSRHTAMHARDDPSQEPGLLVVVHLNHRHPVVGHCVQPQTPRNVNQIQDILLETSPAPSSSGSQHITADARVQRAGLVDGFDVTPDNLADGAERVDTTQSLRQHGISPELGQLRRPAVHRLDQIARHPCLVNRGQRSGSLVPGWCLLRSDQYSRGMQEVGYCRTLGQELGVGEDFELRLVVRGHFKLFLS